MLSRPSPSATNAGDPLLSRPSVIRLSASSSSGLPTAPTSTSADSAARRVAAAAATLSSATASNSAAVPSGAAAARGGTGKATPGAAPPPEVHILGEIVGGTGFGNRRICCKWSFTSGDKWSWLEGALSGQTQTSAAEVGSSFALWSHPLDLHFVAGAMHGWPQAKLTIYEQDAFGRLDLLGYSVIAVPTEAGSHEVSSPVWRPLGSEMEEMSAFFLGGNPSLTNTNVVAEALSERHRLRTTGTGTVHVHFDVLLRHMEAHGVEW